jgi:hypothetical protein
LEERYQELLKEDREKQEKLKAEKLEELRMIDSFREDYS